MNNPHIEINCIQPNCINSVQSQQESSL